MRLVLMLTLALLEVLATRALAQPAARKAIPLAIPVPVVKSTHETGDPTLPVSCTLGYSGPRSFVIDYLQPPDDSYFMTIQLNGCSACATRPGVWISSVKLALDFRVPCSLPVEVAVVTPAADTACAPPRPPITVGGPWPGTVTATTSGVHDFTLSLGRPVAVTHDAYLQVRFTGIGAGCNTDATRPRLVTTASCIPCVAWNYYPADTADMCALLLPGTPVIWATVDSCVSASLTGVPPGGSLSGSMRVSPNPAHEDSDISFTLAAQTRVQVVLHDVRGRHVRELFDAPLAAGEQHLHWDGRDTGGRRVPPGTYLVVVRTSEGATARNVVFVR